MKRWMTGLGILLLVLLPLGYLFVSRPVVALVPDTPGICVKNAGDMDALIYRVDGFWYWAGKVALLSNLPPVRQKLDPGNRLQLPHIPGPERERAYEGPWYMKLMLRYVIPGIPIFRYRTLLYFRFDPIEETWTPIKEVPPKHRPLGKIGLGQVGIIELDFQE